MTPIPREPESEGRPLPIGDPPAFPIGSDVPRRGIPRDPVTTVPGMGDIPRLMGVSVNDDRRSPAGDPARGWKESELPPPMR